MRYIVGWGGGWFIGTLAMGLGIIPNVIGSVPVAQEFGLVFGAAAVCSLIGVLLARVTRA